MDSTNSFSEYDQKLLGFSDSLISENAIPRPIPLHASDLVNRSMCVPPSNLGSEFNQKTVVWINSSVVNNALVVVPETGQNPSRILPISKKKFQFDREQKALLYAAVTHAGRPRLTASVN